MFFTLLLDKFPTLYHTQIHSFYKLWEFVTRIFYESPFSHPFLIKRCYSKYNTKIILNYREFKISMCMPSIGWPIKKNSQKVEPQCKSSARILIYRAGNITATLPLRLCSKRKILFLTRTFGINRDKILWNRKEPVSTTFQNTHFETVTLH